MTLNKIWVNYLTYKYSDHSWAELEWEWWGRYHPRPPISSQYFLWFQSSVRFISIEFQTVDLKRLAGPFRFIFGPFLSWFQWLGCWLFQTLSRTSFTSTFIWWRLFLERIYLEKNEFRFGDLVIPFFGKINVLCKNVTNILARSKKWAV